MGQVIGLTGGIGSGKSAAAEAFAALGAPVIDVDLISHALTGPGGTAMRLIATAFGPTVVAADGGLDRAAMRERVFAEPAERRRLEAILHPMIRQESDRQVAAALATGAPYVVLMVPLLIESGDYAQRCDRVVVVDCPEALQIERVVRRSGLAPAQVRNIMATQANRAERLAAADDVIANDNGIAVLQQRVAELDRKYREHD